MEYINYILHIVTISGQNQVDIAIILDINLSTIVLLLILQDTGHQD